MFWVLDPLTSMERLPKVQRFGEITILLHHNLKHTVIFERLPDQESSHIPIIHSRAATGCPENLFYISFCLRKMRTRDSMVT